MARYTDAVCRLCRREGQKLFLKGQRCYSAKCAIDKRAYAPGQHGQSRKKLSGYGQQLREKQKAKRFYGVLEKQFAHYFEIAEKKAGVTGENLLQVLESRFDNVIYRLGFGLSRAEARQLVVHGHFLINGNKVDIPSYLCKAGEELGIKKASLDSEKFKAVLEANASRPVPQWLEAAAEAHTAKIVALPERDQIFVPVEEHLIVEFYSK